jgi:aldehyde:ferredoxin oxidoreductase
MPTEPDHIASEFCQDCPNSCRKENSGKKKKLAAYAALWGLDQSLDGFDEFVAAYHRHCDDVGVDAFETARAIAMGQAVGLVAAGFGGILEAVNEISRGSNLGRILGNGAGRAALAWNVTPPEAGPRKKAGHPESEVFFLDSVGLCAFAYSAMPPGSELWEVLSDLLKAKYGPSFDGEKLKHHV